MVTPRDVMDAIELFAPFERAEDWDNSGLLVDSGNSTDKILFCLDVTEETIDEAKSLGCGIIVSHHPVIFDGISSISADEPVMLAAQKGISVISAHTNYDAADGGINDVLCDVLEIERSGKFADGAGRVGELKEAMTAEDFGRYVAYKLKTDRVSIVYSKEKVKRVAVFGGAFKEMHLLPELSVDALVTGEIRHDEALEAKRYGVTAIAAGHFATENPGMIAMMKYILEIIGDKAECVFSERGKDPFCAVSI